MSTPNSSSSKSTTTPLSPRSRAMLEDMMEWSDDEKQDAPMLPIDFQTACEMQLSFGKHKGQTVGEMLSGRKTRQYLRWCLENFEGLFDDTRAAIEICLAAYESARDARPVANKRKFN
jgi:hypothetical protein